MQIILNDQAYHSQGSGNQTVQQLADDICGQSAGDEARIIVSLACDGQPIESDRLQQVLESPLDQFSSVQLQTATVREQVSSTLDQAIDVLRNAHSIREDVADSLSQGRHDAAMVDMRKLLEVFRQVQQTTLLACQLLGVQADDLRTEQTSFGEILEGVRQGLSELKNGMESQDFVLVSDLLRYQFAKPLDDWTSILQQLRDVAGSISTHSHGLS